MFIPIVFTDKVKKITKEIAPQKHSINQVIAAKTLVAPLTQKEALT